MDRGEEFSKKKSNLGGRGDRGCCERLKILSEKLFSV